MIDDRELQAAIGSWLREPAGMPDDLGEVLVRLSTTPQRRGWLPALSTRGMRAMFTATRLVVAALIVALFGAFIATGTIGPGPSREALPGATESSASASPEAGPTEAATPPALLAGVDLDIEQTEPHVYRVDGDGVRDLGSEPVVDCGRLLTMFTGRIVAGLDGSVWLFWPDHFVRLGDPEEHAWADDQVALLELPIAVGPDGTVWHGSHGWVAGEESSAGNDHMDRCPGWWSGDGALRAFDAQGWRVAHQEAYASTDELGIEPDGTVWIAWGHRDDETGKNARVDVARLEDGTWSDLGPVGTERDGDVQDLTLSEAGSVFVLTQRYGGGEVLWQLASDGPEPSWEESDRVDKDVRHIVATPDGRLWARLSDGLALRDGEVWRLFDPPKGTSWDQGFSLGPSDLWLSGADGSLWVAPWSDSETSACAGLARFDGERWTRYLDRLCVYSADVATDGSVWVRAGKWADRSHPRVAGSVDTYVVVPD